MKTSMVTFGLVGGLLLTPMLFAESASAYSDGQTGLTGRVQGESCLKCHGRDQYSGSVIEVVGAEMGNCLDGNGTVTQFPILTGGQSYTVKLTVNEPGADEAACPLNNCCDAANPPAAGDVCLTLNAENGVTCAVDEFEGCCRATLTNCPDGKSVGFNLEATDTACEREADCAGVGAFSADVGSGVRLGSVLGEDDPTQVTHAFTQEFDGNVVWELDYTAPNQAPAGVSFWSGVNVANGNFLADTGDLNSNYRLVAFLQNGEEVSAPPFCAVCPNGALPDDSGQCAACTCVGAGEKSLPAGLAAFALIGLALGRRRRRR